MDHESKGIIISIISEEQSTFHLLSHFGTSLACPHLFCNDYSFLRQGLIQQIRLNLFRSVTTCREMLAPSNDWLLIGHSDIIQASYWLPNIHPESLTLTWWLGCCLALWIHFICHFCHSWYIYDKSFKHCNMGHSFQILGDSLWLGKGFCQLKESWSIWSTLLIFYNSSKEGKHCPYKTSILDISNKGIILGNPFL